MKKSIMKLTVLAFCFALIFAGNMSAKENTTTQKANIEKSVVKSGSVLLAQANKETAPKPDVKKADDNNKDAANDAKCKEMKEKCAKDKKACCPKDKKGCCAKDKSKANSKDLKESKKESDKK
ncbi:MAG: hypothetical protein QG635_700 [Bacteroidota bacterium]|nr:hypothetical protein [Bacteroidota bacterium]